MADSSLRAALQSSRQAVKQSFTLPVGFSTAQSQSIPFWGNPRLVELKERLRNEEYLRATFQRLCLHLKTRVEELTPYHQEVAELRTELTQTRRRKEKDLFLERNLREKIAKLDKILAEMEEELNSKTSVAELQQENDRLKSALMQLQERYDLALKARSHLRRCLI